MSPYDANNLEVVRAFNLLVECAETVGAGELTQCRTIADALHVANSGDKSLAKLESVAIDDVSEAIAYAAPRSLVFDATLLLRHASGEFYQEAHFELERQAYLQSSLFGGLVPNATRRGTQQRDARFTPPELARTLIEQCLDELDLSNIARLTILDPACGSGVFMQESLRELEGRFAGEVEVAGMDASPISVEISRFGIQRAVGDANDAGLSAGLSIECRDALDSDWGTPTVVLMNPPFTSYRDMTREDRDRCRQNLPGLTHGHFDKSMAFVWKAVRSVQPGGIVASVLPSSLLDGENGKKWRGAILEEAELRSVGRFKGYSYFQGATVEPAFIVLKKRDGTQQRPNPIVVLVAEENAADAAMRSLRMGRVDPKDADSVFLSTDSIGPTTSDGWMPRAYKHQDLLAKLRNTPVVGQLFTVHLGVIAGSNQAFVLSVDDYRKLPENEKTFFRPAAGTQTIQQCRIVEEDFVFYPYDEAGLLISNEEDLANKLPTYYRNWLQLNEKTLRDRPAKRGDPSQWWALTEHRAWQRQFRPKFVTAYFGSRGKFAYDETGRFVALHGYAWFWRGPDSRLSPETDEEDGGANEIPVSFDDTQAPLAYLALLNSTPFSILLSCFCPRVQGGQFNLSKRFVRQVPIPDFVNEQVPGDVIGELSEIGRKLSLGEEADDGALTHLVARAYGVGTAEWGLDDQPRAQ